MARNYAPLFYEYLEEMGDLTDAEFGRLARALLVYSSTGEFPALSGNERLFKRRVIMQEDRAQTNYRETSEQTRINGSRGGRPSKPKETEKNREKPEETENNPTEAKKPKSKSKSISISPSDEGECVPRARRFTPPTYEEVLSYACDRGFPDLAQRFFDYFTAGDWIDSKGNKVKNWKQKFLTWESAEKERRTSRGNGETAGERPASDWGLDAIVL